MELNKVFLIGNLTRDPESKTTSTGAMVVKMGLASNRRAGKGKEEVLYIDVEAWNKTAELCEQYLRKGSQVLVEGRLKLDQYTNQQGEKRSKVFVVADRVQFGAKGDSSTGRNYSASDQGFQRDNQERPAVESSESESSQDDPDDLPF